MATGKYAKKAKTRKGNEPLIKMMDGAPKPGLFAAKIGFDTELLLTKPPTPVKILGSNNQGNDLVPRGFRIKDLPAYHKPYVILVSEDKQIEIKAIVLGDSNERTDRMSYVQMDTVWFVYQGSGVCYTELGVLNYVPGDFIYVPRSITHSFICTGAQKSIFVGMESGKPLEKATPGGFQNKNIPYNDSVVQIPDPIHITYGQDPPDSGEDEWHIMVKRAGRWRTTTLPFSPYNAIAYDGTSYPFIVHVSDLRFSSTYDEHPDPSNFAVFSTPDRSALISALKSRFIHSIPYNHKNESDEFLFYAKEYGPRKGSKIQEGDATFHPQGIWHGPQMDALESYEHPDSAKDMPWREELAIMFESSSPLLMNVLGRDADVAGIEIEGYWEAWFEGWKKIRNKL